MRNLTVITPVLLCAIGLLLSWDYKHERHRLVLRVFQGLSAAVAVTAAIGWLVGYPQWAVLTISLVAIGVNLPLAALGLKKNPERNNDP